MVLLVGIQGVMVDCALHLNDGVPARLLHSCAAQHLIDRHVPGGLLDVNQADSERHRALTGRENAQTLRTAAWLEAHGKPFWLRYVLVPGISDAEADIRALGERLGGYKSVERVELLPYHTLGVHKYEAMGLEYKLRDVRELSLIHI